MIYQVIDDKGQQLDARYEAGEGYLALLSRGGSKKIILHVIPIILKD